MSPSIIKPALAVAVAVLAVPVAASAHGTCKPAKTVKTVHRVVHRSAPKPVKAVRTHTAIPPCDCARRTVVRYVQAPPPPPVRRVVIYRTHPEPVYRHAPYVEEAPVVYSGYARRSYIHREYRHDYARRDVAYDGRWRHYDWRDDRPY